MVARGGDDGRKRLSRDGHRVTRSTQREVAASEQIARSRGGVTLAEDVTYHVDPRFEHRDGGRGLALEGEDLGEVHHGGQRRLVLGTDRSLQLLEKRDQIVGGHVLVVELHANEAELEAVVERLPGMLADYA